VRVWLLLLLLVMALSGCLSVSADELAGRVAHAPEDAVFDWMSQQPPEVGDTTAIRQIVHFDEARAAVLLSFRPEDWEYAQPALALFVVEKQGDRWVAKAHDYNSRPELTDDILSFYSPPWANAEPSAVYGLVVDDRVTSVGLTWEDGLEQQVQVVNSSYLSIRTDAPGTRGASVTALNAEGHALTEYIRATK
jgi:hypothetical protein